ncbi:MAG: hypothetical protein H7Y13_17835 [Sphingobacteriaceae bacterium]|nr:hypothetical protein [Sphingobacteriaceae bacterium]
MRTTIIYLKFIALVLLVAFQKDAFSQTYTVYQAGTTQIVLTPSMPSASTYVIQPTDAVEWKNTTNATIKNTLGTANVTIVPAELDAGLNTWEVKVKSAASGAEACWSDPTTITIYKLPTLDITLSAATDPEYCDNITASSALTVTVAPTAGSLALPAGVTINYTWAVTKDGSPLATSIGSHVVSAVAPWTDVFTVTTTNYGIYTFSVKAAYAVSSGTLKSDYEKSLAVGDIKTIKVYQTPSAPTIAVQ